MINRDNQRALIIKEARSWIGTPYRHQASCKGAGCDCLGLIRGVWRALYGEEPEKAPPYSQDWGDMNRNETLRDAARRHFETISLDEIMPGDVLLFRWREDYVAKHAAIFSTNEHIIHAYEGNGVSEVPLYAWRKRLAYAFRFPPINNKSKN